MQKVSNPLLLAACLLGLAVGGRAADVPAAANPEFAQIHVQTVQLTRIDSNSVDFEIQMNGVAAKSVTLKSMFFQEVTVNGIPVRVKPIYGPFKLKQGQPIGDLPVLKATVAFREMPSLRPLRSAVGDGTAHVHVNLLAQLSLNPLEMLALRSTNAWASTEFDQNLAIDLPGGLVGRAAALASLTAAEPVWTLGNEAQEWRRNRSTFASHANDAFNGPAVSVESSYTIRSRHGETSALHSKFGGMLLPNGRILTTAEAVEPWMFDPSMAEALSRHDVEILPDSLELTVRQTGGAHDYSSRRDEVGIVGPKGKYESVLSSHKHATYKLRFRDAEDNIAFLELAGSHPAHSNEAKSEAQDDSAEWQPAAVLRNALDAQSSPSVWITEARKENGRWMLKDPAGVSALGSPLWIEGGFVGLLQSDSSAMSLKNIPQSVRAETL